MIEARWTGWDGQGLQQVILEDRAARGVILDADGGLSYRIVTDESGATQEISLWSTIGTSLDLTASEPGRWHDANGARPDLDGAIDPDISASPFTNTLPIRRCALAVGEAAEIAALYIDAATLSCRPAPQRYTRLGTHLYRYEGLESGFTAELPVDDHGLVLDYPGLFRRIL